MKRLLILLLLVPILALTMISCEADMRSSLAGFMGGFGGNLYADAGMIKVNTAQAEAAAVTIATIGNAAGSEDVSGGQFTGLGITVAASGAEKMLAPQTLTPINKQKELKDNLGDAFNSDVQKAKLLEDLKTLVTDTDQKKAAQGTVLVLNQALEDLKTSLTGSSELGDALEKLKLPVNATYDNLTLGDMLALQLMTDLISNTIATLSGIGDTGDTTVGAGLAGVTGDKLKANKAEVLSIIDDALFAAEVAEQISGSTKYNFMGDINLGELMDSFKNEV